MKKSAIGPRDTHLTTHGQDPASTSAAPQNTPSGTPAGRAKDGRFAGLKKRPTGGSSTASKDAGPRQRVLNQKTFADKSVRPDKLVATELAHSGITLADGTPVRGNHFGTPKFVMPNAMGNEPHTDSHMHPTNYVQQGLTPKQVLRMMDEIGIRASTMMPIPTSLQILENNRQAINPAAFARETQAGAVVGHDHGHEALHDCGLESYYVPKDIQEREMKRNGGMPLSIEDFKKNPGLIDEIVQRGELYLDTAVNSHLASQLNKANLSQAERSRLDPMITGLNLGDLRSGVKLLVELFHNKGTFTGIGEITVHKELVENMYAGQRGQSNTQNRGNGLNGLKNTLEMAGVVGMPVVLHCDIDNLRAQIEDARHGDNAPARDPANFAGLREMFTDPRIKDTTIIWAHGGGLGRFVQQGKGHLDRLTQLLKDCPNLYLDISWSEVAKQVNNPATKQAWVEFLEKNSTRICFGSDTLAPVSTAKWNETKKMYTEVMSQLSPQAKENILNHTYENVISGARDKVRDFENNVLTPAFYEKHLINPNAEQPLSAATVRAEMEAARAA
ncbi:amidohydrolase family protein [Pandoraea sp. NPDC087047]|uniref:amidohydrolase family protein n=1 Tax=Pandoraea sp. NPDC087047 TaxID=3364390 RepID=UPI0038255225